MQVYSTEGLTKAIYMLLLLLVWSFGFHRINSDVLFSLPSIILSLCRSNDRFLLMVKLKFLHSNQHREL